MTYSRKSLKGPLPSLTNDFAALWWPFGTSAGPMTILSCWAVTSTLGLPSEVPFLRAILFCSLKLSILLHSMRFVLLFPVKALVELSFL